MELLTFKLYARRLRITFSACTLDPPLLQPKQLGRSQITARLGFDLVHLILRHFLSIPKESINEDIKKEDEAQQPCLNHFDTEKDSERQFPRSTKQWYPIPLD